ncbi:unnamed protein product [Calypogeia fissa]
MPKWVDDIIAKFSGGDALPWSDVDMISDCEREAASEGAGLTEQTDSNKSIMRLAWALVHSPRSVDVQRGIAMLSSMVGDNVDALQKREILYLLAVGYFRAGDYTRSRRLVDDALQTAPDFRQAASLKKMIEDKIAQDGALGVGIAATIAGAVITRSPVVLVAGGVATYLLHKKKQNL